MSRILVIEDSGAIRLLIRRRLEMAGHEVIEAADGVHASMMLGDATVPDPDLVLLDAVMPRQDGAQTLASIRECRPGLPVVLVSAVNELELDPRLAGVEARIEKPIDFYRLLETIERQVGTDA